MGCATPGHELQRCVETNSSFGPGFVEALGAIEEHLLATGTLPEVSREGYRALISKLDRGKPLPELEAACAPEQECWRLASPSSSAAYPRCSGRSAEVEARGDLGAAYLRTVLEEMDEEAFSRLVERGALLQPLAVAMNVGGSSRGE